MKEDTKRKINVLANELRSIGYDEETLRAASIPRFLRFGDLLDLIDLIPDSAIEQAIHDQEDRETAETLEDFRASGHHI